MVRYNITLQNIHSNMIKQNIDNVRKELLPGVRLVAVSKTKPVEALQAAYDAGQRIFGENKALEMRDKHAVLPNDIEWHFIGHLQSNKIKYIVDYVSLIHSIDSLRLLEAVNHEAKKRDRVVDCLLQFHIASEETKFGLDYSEAEQIMEKLTTLCNVRIVGVMGMATNTPDESLIRTEFANLKSLFNKLKTSYFSDDASFREISMGMSGDYQIAMQEGSTLVRIGSSIFGVRNYNIPVND